VQEGKIWSVLNAIWHPSPDPNNPMGYYTYSTEKFMFYGDIIVDDKEYKKLYISTKEYPNFPQDWSLHNLMREDDNKKVWYKKNINSTEKLYYDFSLKIGDTVSNPWSETPVIVEDVTYKTMNNGKERKVLHLSSFVFANSNKECWIEGIGSTVGLIYPLFGYVVGGYYELLCSYENEEIIFINDNSDTCYKSSIGIEVYENKIKIYPNPVKDILFIEAIDNYDINYISLINIYGQTVSQYEAKINKINVSDIPFGLYFIKFSTHSGKDIVQKLIINK
ncbi:MAG: T9SS type A sorting domain-containing protein, partial [Spirochaetaceae bacterium]|nr:T9SS type A sorting domain-containing protein [Spirochaetaceae bacterium]